MIYELRCTKLLNENEIKKTKNYLAMTEFRRELATRGADVRGKLWVDFRTKPGIIMVWTHRPPIILRNMRSMFFNQLDTEEYKAYIRMRDNYRKSGGIRTREVDEVTGEMKTTNMRDDLTKSALSKLGFVS